uniref:Uncharacterized protein n=1 Tax=Arundo donax TaxID=35708 RepID=A0A0A8ZD38_ARUDO
MLHFCVGENYLPLQKFQIQYS